jgi:hypothetical protein
LRVSRRPRLELSLLSVRAAVSEPHAPVTDDD